MQHLKFTEKGDRDSRNYEPTWGVISLLKYAYSMFFLFFRFVKPQDFPETWYTREIWSFPFICVTREMGSDPPPPFNPPLCYPPLRHSWKQIFSQIHPCSTNKLNDASSLFICNLTLTNLKAFPPTWDSFEVFHIGHFFPCTSLVVNPFVQHELVAV